MTSPRTQYKVMRGSGMSRWGAAWFLVLLVLVSPFVALATWATPKEKDFGKFREDENDSE